MSSTLLVTALLGLLMARRLADIYLGGHYVCPSCGAKDERRHSSDCPWSHPPSN
ncbi:MAG: hypothetical protein M3O73_08310 [Actinomycetota bacterium]|jgi:hypothetical protein|nr:hypothetical protein [Actinomycetota bacterium]